MLLPRTTGETVRRDLDWFFLGTALVMIWRLAPDRPATVAGAWGD